MLTGSRYVLILVLALVSCEKQRTNDVPYVTDTLHLDAQLRSCDLGSHSYARFQCFRIKRISDRQYDYSLVVLSPKIRLKKNSQAKLKIEPKDRYGDQALISIPGGPGQGGQTEETWVQSWADWMAHNQLDMSLVLYEPPGTLGSSLFFECEAYDNASLRVAAEALTEVEEAEFITPIYLQCLHEYDRFIKGSGFGDAGLKGLSTQVFQKELSLLIDALNFKRVHVVGTSYGSRVALSLPSHSKISSLTLDSPYPFKSGTLLDWPFLMGNAFKLHEARLRKENVEGVKEGLTNNDDDNYSQLFKQAYDYLAKQPQSWELERWDGRGYLKFVLTPERLLSVHFSILYSAESLPLYYKGLKNIQSKPDEMRWVLEEFVTNAFDPEFNAMLYAAVECNDNAHVDRLRFMDEADLSIDQYTDWHWFYETDFCQNPLFNQSNKIQNRMYAETPAIILSGEYDPITPKQWAEALKPQLLHSKLLIKKNTGHGVLMSGDVIDPEISTFWRQTGNPNGI